MVAVAPRYAQPDTNAQKKIKKEAKRRKLEPTNRGEAMFVTLSNQAAAKANGIRRQTWNGLNKAKEGAAGRAQQSIGERNPNVQEILRNGNVICPTEGSQQRRRF